MIRSVGQIPATEVPQPSKQDILRDKLSQIISNILVKSQEIGFELVTCECQLISTCPIAKKSKELIKELKNLFELRKEMSM